MWLCIISRIDWLFDVKRLRLLYCITAIVRAVGSRSRALLLSLSLVAGLSRAQRIVERAIVSECRSFDPPPVFTFSLWSQAEADGGEIARLRMVAGLRAIMRRTGWRVRLGEEMVACNYRKAAYPVCSLCAKAGNFRLY